MRPACDNVRRGFYRESSWGVRTGPREGASGGDKQKDHTWECWGAQVWGDVSLQGASRSPWASRVPQRESDRPSPCSVLCWLGDLAQGAQPL